MSKKKESWVKRLLFKLISLQDDLADDKQIKRYFLEGEGKYGVIEIYGPDGGVWGFKVAGRRLIPWEGGGNPNTIISMSEDVFLDILSGERSVDDAWARGLVKFSGKNWMYDSQRFREGFKQLQYLIALVWKARR